MMPPRFTIAMMGIPMARADSRMQKLDLPEKLPAQGYQELLLSISDASLENDSVAHSLAILSQVYHYNHWIYNCVRPFLWGAILEVGAGVGNITQFLLNHPRIACLEPSKPYVEYLKNRFADHANVSIHQAMIEALPNKVLAANSFNSIVCANVLEHIKEDQSALSIMAQMVDEGGVVAIVVPAVSWIYGRLDERMGHYRRYNRGQLKRMMIRAGLKVVRSRYFNGVGVLGWWIQGKILRHERIPERQTRLFDKLVPILSAFERLLPLPLGQSLVVIGKKSQI
jgi:SAM-dependent methyltransferase